MALAWLSIGVILGIALSYAVRFWLDRVPTLADEHEHLGI
jgi:hypothetical protein